ncbi:MAG: arabinan endo-1,5-alpha-L-arabinosidase [Acidobacteriota bacterium]|nr:arabinan endo-1,5-alpha-L-arabinosidase [Acidobacteriota bacterium]
MRRTRCPTNLTLALVVALVGSDLSCGQSSSPHSANREAAPRALELSGEFAGTHDPSIAYEKGTYYVFATGPAFPPRPAGAPQGPVQADQRPKPLGQVSVRCSPDLHAWQRCGAVFPSIPAWISELSPQTRELWAPDISFFDGLWHLYYSFSVFGKNTSGIALATNTTLDPASPDYNWVDHGLVLQSKQDDDFNAIDPNLVIDQKGEAWLAFGSFWSGIKMRHLDRSTGLPSPRDTHLYSLASRGAAPTPGPRNPDLPPDTEAVEAPFILHHGGFYYLFVSWDLCCRGLKSTYRTMVGRSPRVTGPFLARDGKPMLEGGGTPLLRGNARWLGPGGASLLHLPAQDIIVFHAYSAVDGRPSLHISTLGWKDGWPSAALEGDLP